VKLRLTLSLLVLAGCGGAEAQPASAVHLQQIGKFDSPVYVTAPPGDTSRVFVVEQGGTIRVVRDGKKLSTPFLDVRGKVTAGGEQGLLSLAFAPDYATSGLFYVYYTNKQGNEQVFEYHRASADRADPASARQVLEQADQEPNHNGGLLLFGPDRQLYIGIGDGGGAGDQHGAHGNGQNLGTLMGKILRIDPKASGGRPFTIPAGNPFAARAGARPEIWAYGLRNPWRFTFDAGHLIIGDVGQDKYEEVDYVGSGKGDNFGWRVFEGDSRYTQGESAPGAIRPVIVEKHSDGNCSVTGGVVIRDPSLGSWRGRYIFGDYCRGVLQIAKLPHGKVTDTGLKVSSLTSFGVDARHRVYAASQNGPVYRLVAR
jgi:glucose/arabinose dehydrogenase